MTKKMFECSCCCHGVTIETLDWEDGVEIYMVWWNRGGEAWDIKQRLRHIWYVLKFGKPMFQNEIIFTPMEAKGFAEHLTKISAEAIDFLKGKEAP